MKDPKSTLDRFYRDWNIVMPALITLAFGFIAGMVVALLFLK